MTQARRGMKLKRTHPRVGRKRKAVCPWDRGGPPPISPHVCSSLCSFYVFFSPIPREKGVKIGARWSIFGRESLAKRGGFENK